jgi:hypothetical protein
MTPSETLAFDILGERPGVSMSFFGGEAMRPHVAVARTADNLWILDKTQDEADLVRSLACELAEDLDKGYPAWRGHSIEYEQ